MKIIFVRHGQSTGNAGLPCFDLSQLDLTALGQTQAAHLAARWPTPPDLIAVSPYLRTHRTAQPTMARFPSVPVEELPMEEFTYLTPEQWNGTSRHERLPHIEAYWRTANPDYCDGPGAESFATLLQRVDRTLARLAALPQGSLVYAFSHGQFMQATRVCLLHPEWTAQQKMAHFWPFNTQHPILNTDLLELTLEAGTWRTPGVEDKRVSR